MSESKSKSQPRPAGTRVGDGEIETSTAEKVLAVVLAVFIVIGAGWAYDKLDEVAGSDSTSFRAPNRELIGPEEVAKIEEHEEARDSVQMARSHRQAATRSLELSREAYRTALDADEPSAELKLEYEVAQARLAAVSRKLAAGIETEARTRPAAEEAQERLTELRREEAERADDDRVRHDRIVFVLRLALLALMLAGAYRLLIRLRSRNSRYLPAALAWVGIQGGVGMLRGGP